MIEQMTKYETLTLGFALGAMATGATFSDAAGSAPTVNVRLMPRDLATLQTLQGVFGGVIYGEYRHVGKDGKERCWIDWKLRGRNLYEALSVIEMVMPDCYKKEQFREWRKTAEPTLKKQRYQTRPRELRVKQHPNQIQRWESQK